MNKNSDKKAAYERIGQQIVDFYGSANLGESPLWSQIVQADEDLVRKCTDDEVGPLEYHLLCQQFMGLVRRAATGK